MRFNIFDGETLINSIEASESFCISYCQKNKYTYELIPNQNLTIEDNIKTNMSIECFNTFVYTGTGTYGQSNPTTIQLPQTPKQLSIYTNNSSNTTLALEWVTGMNNPVSYTSAPISEFQVSDNGIVSFYSTSPTNQLNEANVEYTVAFMY